MHVLSNNNRVYIQIGYKIYFMQASYVQFVIRTFLFFFFLHKGACIYLSPSNRTIIFFFLKDVCPSYAHTIHLCCTFFVVVIVCSVLQCQSNVLK